MDAQANRAVGLIASVVNSAGLVQIFGPVVIADAGLRLELGCLVTSITASSASTIKLRPCVGHWLFSIAHCVHEDFVCLQGSLQTLVRGLPVRRNEPSQSNNGIL